MVEVSGVCTGAEWDVNTGSTHVTRDTGLLDSHLIFLRSLTEPVVCLVLPLNHLHCRPSANE